MSTSTSENLLSPLAVTNLLKLRLNVAITYIVLGVILIVGTFITKTENDFISTFGFMMILMGLVRIRNYRIITKDEDTIRKQQIIETDERNISIVHKAKSAAFAVYTFILGAAVIVLSFIGMHEAAKWVAYSVCLLVVIYWICYFIYQKKS